MAEYVTCPACRGAGLLATPACEVCNGDGILPTGNPWPEMTAKMARVQCVYCQAVGLIEAYWKLEAKPPGTFSLSGSTMKASAFWWPYARCGACGHESRAQIGSKDE